MNDSNNIHVTKTRIMIVIEMFFVTVEIFAKIYRCKSEMQMQDLFLFYCTKRKADKL